MSFKDMVEADIRAVFLNTQEFGELRSIRYDGVTYTDIPRSHAWRENERPFAEGVRPCPRPI